MTPTTEFRSLLDRAAEAGRRAAAEAVPTPMVVVEADLLTGRPRPGGRSWGAPEGPCGFAWVTIRPATSALARYIRRHEMAPEDRLYPDPAWHARCDSQGGSWHRSSGGGYEFWVWSGGQSVARKEAYAQAYARVLTEAGWPATYGSRLD